VSLQLITLKSWTSISGRKTFSTPADSASSANRWEHWKRILENYLSRLAEITAQDKLDILISLLDSTVYEYIRECSTYDDAMACLDNVFVKPVNEVYARHRLNTCQQKPGESIDEFLQRLKAVSVDCNFTDVSTVLCKEAAVRDAFVAGLRSAYIRQRLIQDNVIDLRATFERARTLYGSGSLPFHTSGQVKSANFLRTSSIQSQ